ncbi:unnamed protein product [Trifolium pratense]|uniref:Uncharacterized protein n=1 Tax=Trifolium pratense TaxID=57577 RepID=A0ACB0LM66_TRIPR|nr:unnamed protein product [Trifolium pratense]
MIGVLCNVPLNPATPTLFTFTYEAKPLSPSRTKNQNPAPSSPSIRTQNASTQRRPHLRKNQRRPLSQLTTSAVLSLTNPNSKSIQYFADRDIFCAGRVAEEDLKRVAAATGGTVQTSVNNIIDEVLGTCEIFEEKQVGNERFNIFNGCPSGQTTTIVLRGGADQFIEEAERSLHDAIMIVRRAMKNSTVVAGGGAIDMEISRYLRQHARTIAGKSQLFINSYAKALEVFDDPTSLTEEEMYELRNNWATCFLDLYNPEVDYVVSDDEV